jgi:hypothetical protein
LRFLGERWGGTPDTPIFIHTGSDDSSDGDSDSESAEIGEAEVRKRQLNKAVEVYRSLVRDFIEQEEAEAARKKAKSAGGAAKSTNARL